MTASKAEELRPVGRHQDLNRMIYTADPTLNAKRFQTASTFPSILTGQGFFVKR
jgi:hypothetical protein